MTAMGMTALTVTWCVIGVPKDFDYVLSLEVWVREILG